MMKQEQHGCGGCPIAEQATARRDFLRDASRQVLGVLAALGVTARAAEALPVRLVSALRTAGEEHIYPLPATDGVQIDKNTSVIIARYQGAVYAFSLACPHQNTALKWEEADGRFQCPKHKSRYRPDGTFIEGRATRGLDRFAVRRDGNNLVVDLDKLYEEDKSTAEWKSAVVRV